MESEGPGLGARFIFTIPAADGSASEFGWPSTGVQRAERDKERILVVDGDPRALWYVRDTLSDGGYYPI